jgi:hypothetical protein
MFAAFLFSFPRSGAGVSPRVGAHGLALVVGSAAFGSACAVESDPLFDNVESLAPLAGRAGNLPNFSQRPSGSGGSGGRAGVGASMGGGEGEPTGVVRQGQNVDGGLSEENGSDRADAGNDGGATCAAVADCNDANPCTLDDCTAGLCEHRPAGAGLACGSAAENDCSLPDTCDGAGRCVPNDVALDTPCGTSANACSAEACDGAGACVPRALPADTPCGVSNGCGQPTCSGTGTCVPHDAANGSACPGGSCSVGACVQGQRVGCPQAVVSSVPFETNWNSAGLPDLFDGTCEGNNTPDYAVLFVVPAAGRYRFDATGSPDSVVTVASGACSAGNATQIGCDDDVAAGNRASRLEVTLTAGQTVTIYVSEFEDGNSGRGTLRVTAL